MPAPLKNPLTVPAERVIATGARLDELTAEATRKLAYIFDNFRACRQYVGDSREFNRCLARLKKALAGSFDAARDLHGLPLAVFLVAQRHAEENADRRGNFGDLTADDMEAGARHAVDVLRPYRGRSADHVLRYHVEGLMATIQECSGLPVLATRSKGDVYDPQGSNALGCMLIEQVRRIDPSVPQTRIVNIMLDARRKQAGKDVRFRHYFPTYGTATRRSGPAAAH